MLQVEEENDSSIGGSSLKFLSAALRSDRIGTFELCVQSTTNLLTRMSTVCSFIDCVRVVIKTMLLPICYLSHSLTLFNSAKFSVKAKERQTRLLTGIHSLSPNNCN